VVLPADMRVVPERGSIFGSPMLRICVSDVSPTTEK
jgi:hypothetical protein